MVTQVVNHAYKNQPLVLIFKCTVKLTILKDVNIWIHATYIPVERCRPRKQYAEWKDLWMIRQPILFLHGNMGIFMWQECRCFNNCCIYLSITRPRWKGRAIVSPCPPSVDNKAGPALHSSCTQYVALKIWPCTWGSNSNSSIWEIFSFLIFARICLARIQCIFHGVITCHLVTLHEHVHGFMFL